jgi:biopolymer transport protein ExbB/TolQ
LIATAFGLVAAIPATIGYNYIDQRIGDLLEELAASSEGWVRVMAGRQQRPHTAGAPGAHQQQAPHPAGAGG